MTHRLVTIRYSHYCEKARWALERAEIAFVEEPHLPVLSWIWTLGSRGNRTAPVFVTEDGTAIAESTDVLRFADAHGKADVLFPKGDAEVERLEEHFDRYLGPTARRAVYNDVLRLERAQLAALFAKDVPAWEKRVARVATPVICEVIRRGLRVTPSEVKRSKEKVDEIFGEVAERLRDGRPYLTGDRFTAADLTFASLAAPILYPDKFARYVMPFETLTAAIRDTVLRYRETPAGTFGMRMYDRHRDGSGKMVV
jgi:glutathione S-transferase